MKRIELLVATLMVAGCMTTEAAGGFVVAKDGAAKCVIVSNGFKDQATELAGYLETVPLAKSPAKDPTGPAAGVNRVVKGGAYCFTEDFSRIDARFLCEPTAGNWTPIGFRYVIPAEVK